MCYLVLLKQWAGLGFTAVQVCGPNLTPDWATECVTNHVDCEWFAIHVKRVEYDSGRFCLRVD